MARHAWEWVHKGAGWVALVLGVPTISLGILTFDMQARAAPRADRIHPRCPITALLHIYPRQRAAPTAHGPTPARPPQESAAFPNAYTSWWAGYGGMLGLTVATAGVLHVRRPSVAGDMRGSSAQSPCPDTCHMNSVKIHASKDEERKTDSDSGSLKA